MYWYPWVVLLAFSGAPQTLCDRMGSLLSTAAAVAPTPAEEPSTTSWDIQDRAEALPAPTGGELELRCEICQEDLTKQTVHLVIKPCGHSFCSACGITHMAMFAQRDPSDVHACPVGSCNEAVDHWEHYTTSTTPKRNRNGGTHVKVLSLAPPGIDLRNSTPLLNQYQDGGADVVAGTVWVGYKIGEGGGGEVREHVYGLDHASDCGFSAEMGVLAHTYLFKPEANTGSPDAHILTVSDLLNQALKDQSSTHRFLYAAATGKAEFPILPDTKEERAILGTTVALHIIFNLVHRERTGVAQQFMSRVIETSGASENARRLMTRLCLSISRAADWGDFSDRSLKPEQLKVGSSAC
jgi:hypothetical protein